MNQRFLMLVGIALVALLSITLFSFVPSTPTDLLPRERALAVGEILSPLTLHPDERIEIDYAGVGCRRGGDWIFVLLGGPERRLAVIDTDDSYRSPATAGPHPSPIGAITLSLRECRGLGDLFQYYRHPDLQEDCRRPALIRVSYFRGSTRVGAEQFIDSGSVENWIYRRDEGEQIPVASRVTPEMISFPQLVTRAAQADQPAEPALAANTAR